MYFIGLLGKVIYRNKYILKGFQRVPTWGRDSAWRLQESLGTWRLQDFSCSGGPLAGLRRFWNPNIELWKQLGFKRCVQKNEEATDLVIKKQGHHFPIVINRNSIVINGFVYRTHGKPAFSLFVISLPCFSIVRSRHSIVRSRAWKTRKSTGFSGSIEKSDLS